MEQKTKREKYEYNPSMLPFNVTLKDQPPKSKKDPCWFVDADYGDFRSTIRNMELSGKKLGLDTATSTHPIRANKRKVETKFERHGVTTFAVKPEVIAKIKKARQESNKVYFKFDQSMLPNNVRLKDPSNPPKTRKQKTTFIDSEYGEFVGNVYTMSTTNRSTHPARRLENSKKTMIDNYGVVSNFGRKEVIAKREATVSEKYGVTNVSHISEVKEKISEANKEKADRALEARINTVQEKYGVDNVTQIESVITKVKAAHKERRVNVKHVLPNGETAVDFAEKFGRSPTYARYIIKHYGEQAAQDWIENSKKKAQSSLEMRFLENWDSTIVKPEFLGSKYLPEALVINRRIKPDFKFEYNGKVMYVETDGLAYHSEAHQDDRMYHFNKRKLMESLGLTYLQFHQDEIVYKGKIVNSIIKAKLGIFDRKFFARELVLKQVSQKDMDVFFLENHLMGTTLAKGIGLYNGEELVMCLSYKKEGNGIDIARVASKLNTNVYAGLTRLLSALEKQRGIEFIQSFVDLRYGTGHSLTLIGYEALEPFLSFKWTDGGFTFGRRKCTAGNGKTEAENAAELGWCKIFDAGQQKFIKRLTPKPI